MLQDQHIKTEEPMQKMWTLFLYYQNEPSVKKLLYDTYIALPTVEGENQAVRLAFENTPKFIYFLKQGVAYFKSAKQSEFIVRPLLLYYGVTSLMKAIILLNDPLYPRTTSVLQHGLTTRKKKKLHYQLFLDEIKVQRDGLLPLFTELILKKPIKIHSKYKVGELFGMIPELQDSFSLETGERTLLPVHIRTHQIQQLDKEENNGTQIWELAFDQDTLNQTKYSFKGLVDLFMDGLSLDESMIKADQRKLTLYFQSDNPEFSPSQHVQLFRNSHGDYFFYAKQALHVADELVVFNMLSYLLGMLCRYDTELWGELVFSFSSSDTYLIEEFLQLTLRKLPNLILNQIYRQFLIFIP